MSTIIFLTKKEEKQLYDIGILGASSAIILVTPDAFAAIKQEWKKRGGEKMKDGELQDLIANSQGAESYGFGGDADKFVDVVGSGEHYFVSEVLEELLEKEEESENV